MLIVFLFALSFFAIHSLVERSVQLNNANLDRQWIGASGTISRLIHELQRERGLSSGFIASRGERFGDLLIAQQEQTDSSLNELKSVIREHPAGKALLAKLDAGSKQIHELRPRIKNLELSRDYTVDCYTEIVDALFDLQLSTFGNAKETSIFRKQMALIAFSQAKESAGLERALLSAILSDHNFSAGRMLTLSNIRATEQARLANFVRLADVAAAEQFRGILKQSYIKDAERIRLKVKAAALLHDTHNSEMATSILSTSFATPESWFEISSAKINAMKALEDSLVTGVGVSAEQVEKQAWLDLSVSGLLVLLSFVLAGILIRQIQRGRRVAEHQLNLAEAVFTNSVESILVTDAKQRIVEVNPAFLKISGYSRSEIIGQHAHILKSGRHDAPFFDRMWREINDSGAWVGEIWNRRKNGEIYPALLSIAAVNDPDGKISNYTGMIFDLSQHKTVEALLDQLRTFDGLTELPNREAWLSALDQQLANGKRNNSQFSILQLDLDRFKVINDSLGYSVGDQVLIEAAERIKITLRKHDVVARLGSNRFSVLLSEIADPKAIGSICEKLLTAFGRPFELGGLNVHISASIGAAIFPADGQDSKTLMMAAESALYSAKADGRNLYKYYSREMNEMGTHLFKLERMLRVALERNEFSVVYQPQVSAKNGQLVGVEALLRWNNPELGNVSPVQFIPLAEETGMIVAIGEWVMRVACHQARQWQTEWGVDIPVAVNLSARQFRRNDLLASVQTVLDETGLPSRLLELEITEGLLMVDPIGAIDIMRGLNCLGVKTALDDFGTGYSSLAYLKAFPLNRLKIDRAFVRDLPENESDCAISNTIIALGLNLNMEVLAEGVETEAQRDFLANAGCEVFQGYLFGKPMSAQDLTDRLQAGELFMPKSNTPG